VAGLELTFADEACVLALSDEQLLGGMARFEGALARACAKTGLVPVAEAEIIARVCVAARFEPGALARAARGAGTLAIPFVRQLTEQVAAESPEAARYVHFGATSQDVVDTALVLCVRKAADRILGLTRRLGDAAATIAERHARTAMAARTLLQAALPIPFGWKAAVWLSMLCRSMPRFRDAADDACAMQFGGAGGTLSAFGAKATAVERALAEELSLPVPLSPWHSARDGFARMGSEAAIVAGAAGKIARDVSLLMQPEVGEVAESAAGGSSSMPHKRNPSGSLLALEAAQRVPGLAATLLVQLTPEHERGLGQWQSQWLTLRELLCAASSAVASMAEVLEGLKVDTTAMRTNLQRSRGLVYSEAVSIRLSHALGKSAAHSLVEKLSAAAMNEGKTLLEVLRADAEVVSAIPANELSDLFDPERGFGAAPEVIERVLVRWRQVRATSFGTAP
jgi:3-carboxy-cis,cis-muconate cycloisomerase